MKAKKQQGVVMGLLLLGICLMAVVVVVVNAQDGNNQQEKCVVGGWGGSCNCTVCTIDLEFLDEGQKGWLEGKCCAYQGIPASILAYDQTDLWVDRLDEFNKCTGASLTISYVASEDDMQEAVEQDVGVSNGVDGLEKQAEDIYDAYLLEAPWLTGVDDRMDNLSQRISRSPQINWNDVTEGSRLSVTLNNSVRAFPIETDYVSLGWRKDVLEKYGLEPPETLEELVEMSKFLHGKDHNGDGVGDFGFCMSAQTNYFWSFVAPVLQTSTRTCRGWQDCNGGARNGQNIFFDPLTFEPLFDNAGFRYAMKLLKDFVDHSNCPAQLAQGEKCDRQTAMRSGRCAGVLSLPGTMTKMLLPPNAGGVNAPQPRYGKSGNLEWEVKTVNGSYWGRRKRFPGSSVVWDRETDSLVTCTKSLCPLSELHPLKSDGTLVNYATYMSEGGEIYSIRASAAEKKKSLIWDFFGWIFSLPKALQPIGGIHRYSQLAENSSEREALREENWPPQMVDDLFNVYTDILKENANVARDLLIRGYTDYMDSVVASMFDKFMLHPDVLTVALSPESFDERLDAATAELNQSWIQVSERHGGNLIQLLRLRSAMNLPYMTMEEICVFHAQNQRSANSSVQVSPQASANAFISLGCRSRLNAACNPEKYSYTVSSCQKRNIRTISYYTNDAICKISAPPDPETESLSCSWIPVTSNYGNAIIAMCCVSGCLVFVLLVFLVHNRRHPLVRASQFLVSLGFLGGGLLSCLSPMILLGFPTEPECIARIWFLVLPPTIQLTFLFTKVYRVHRIFYNRSLRRSPISDKQIAIYISAVISIQVLLLIVSSIVDTPTIRSQIVAHEMNAKYCSPNANCTAPMETRCVTTGITQYATYAYMALLVVIGCYLSFSARNLPGAFSEAKLIMFAMYNVAIVVIVISFLYYSIQSLPQPRIEQISILLTFGIVWACCGAVLIVFGPKAYRVLYTSKEDARNEIQLQLKGKRSRSASDDGSDTNPSLNHTCPSCAETSSLRAHVKILEQALHDLKNRQGLQPQHGENPNRSQIAPADGQNDDNGDPSTDVTITTVA